MKITTTLFAIVLIFFINQSYAQLRWQWQNPWPQGNDLFSVWAFSSQEMVASGRYGTLLRTTNAGSTWKVDYIDTSDYRISIRSIHFVDSLNGWSVGGIEGRILPRFIYRTSDGGHRWSRQSTMNLEIVSVHFADQQHGWAVGGFSQGVILKTTDGGTTWLNRSNDSLQALADVFFIDTLVGWAVGIHGFIVKTTDGGDTWFSQSIGALQLLTTHFVDSLTGWIGGTNSSFQGFLAKTTNGGSTWIEQLSRPDEAMFFDVVFSDYLNGCAVGGNPYPYFSTNTGRVYRTTNGGSNWIPVETGMQYPLFSIHSSSSTDGWAVGRVGRIVRTTDGGTWMEQSRGTRRGLRSIAFWDTLAGLAVGEKGIILKTTNGGSSWNSYVLDTLFTFYSVTTGMDGRAWSVGTRRYQDTWTAVIARTTDNGSAWITHLVPTLGGIYSADFVDNSGWFIGWNNLNRFVSKTTDGGVNWSPPQLIDTTGIYNPSIRFLDVQHGWIAGQSRVYRTTDGGSTWSEHSNGITYPIGSLMFVTPLLGWGVGGVEIFNGGPMGGEGVIYKSEDGGQSWTQQLYFPRDAFLSVGFADMLNGWAVGYTGSEHNYPAVLYQTSNAGINWEAINILTKNSFYSLDVVNDRIWICGDYGTIIQVRTGGLTAVEEPLPNLPRSYFLHQNFPNPFNNLTVIEFDVPERAFVIIDVFNVLGQQVRTIARTTMQAGRYKRTFDATGLPSGVYFYRMITGNFSQVRKMVLIK